MTEVDAQWIMNGLLSVLLLICGWVLRTLWEAIKDLQHSDKELVRDISQIRELVAGDYVKRSDFEAYFARLESKLDMIFTRLEGKADK